MMRIPQSMRTGRLLSAALLVTLCSGALQAQTIGSDSRGTDSRDGGTHHGAGVSQAGSTSGPVASLDPATHLEQAEPTSGEAAATFVVEASRPGARDEPRWVVSGEPGGAAPMMELALEGGRPGAQAWLLVSTRRADVRVRGALLVPSLLPGEGLLLPVTLDGAGGLRLTGRCPGELAAGGRLWVQVIVLDPGADGGLAPSDALGWVLR